SGSNPAGYKIILGLDEARQGKTVKLDDPKLQEDWRENLKVAVGHLLYKMRTWIVCKGGNEPCLPGSDFDSPDDLDLSIIENWYMGFAWYNGADYPEADDPQKVYKYVNGIYDRIEHPYEAIKSYTTAISSVGRPSRADMFPKMVPDQVILSRGYAGRTAD